MNRRLWLALWAGAALSVFVAYRMAHLSLVLGSVEGRWVYEYIYGFSWRSMAVCAAAFAVCAALLMIPSDLMRRREWWLLALWLLVGTAVQLRLRALAPYTIARMFESDGSDGYYGATRQYPASVLLREFDRLRPTLTIHPRSNMPGKLVLVYALERLSPAPARLAELVVVLSSVGGLLLYLFARDLTGDVTTAMVALALYLCVPAKLFFLPILNTVTPVIVLGCLVLWQRALRARTTAYAAALGAALFGLTAFEPLPLVTGLVFAGLAWTAIVRGEKTWPALGRQVASAAIAFVSAAVLIGLWMHFDSLAVFRHLMRDAVEFNAAAGRPYHVWVWRDLLDFSIGAGLCQALLFVALVWAAVRRAGGAAALAGEPVAMFAVSLLAAILVTDVLGVNRGEVIRLWIFFACLVQLPAAHACTRLRNRAAALVVIGTSLAVGTVGTSMIAFGQP